MSEPQSFGRRDHLIEIEAAAQAKWDAARAFEVDASDDGKEKYMVTFPFPYMNGVLHLGHAFTLSKGEFAAGYHRLKGRRVLFPFAFHCTGMPIAACATKLGRELELYGNPPVFPGTEPVDGEAEPSVANGAANANGKTTVKKSKGKVTKKASACVYQWQILEETGVPVSTIASFADPYEWLNYFPPVAIEHLKKFGLKADFRRSFITTDMNPYFDAFIRWQFNTLLRVQKIKFGSRLSIYSPSEKQPCADHDRASGEGVGPQEYTGIKLELVSTPPPALAAVLSVDAKIYLLCATLRPETMYGQTNAWVLPHGEYSCVLAPGNEVWICSERSAMNMAHQDLLGDVFGKTDILCKLKGWDLLGAAVKAPLAVHDVVYMLPLLTISMNKGTGLVTSVPSDSPDDWIALQDLRNDEAFRNKYHVTLEMCSMEAPAIIRIPNLGDRGAPFICEQLQIKNQYDSKKLAEAKDKVYKTGFYEGIMLMGSCEGMRVELAKPIVRTAMVEAGQAIIYSEPESEVIARSGNACVVAKTAQWFIEYGEEEWAGQVGEHVRDRLETFNPIAKEMFVGVVEWLREWACSRSFGLGTKLPFDTQFVIESLSDSTIYMAFYTISHFLQGGHLAGAGSSINPELLTDDVFDFIFCDAEMPRNCGLDAELLNRMRAEFKYFYPCDLRVSGKDLIGNHLTMSLYNHAAIWPKQPEYWPQAFYTNGHAMLNNDKMSKSTGNFITMIDSCREYSADATRFALADAGDGLEDANVSLTVTANAAILKLTKEVEWCQEMQARVQDLPHVQKEKTLIERIFANRINECIVNADQAYSRMQFRAALKSGFWDLCHARDSYRAHVSDDQICPELIQRFMEVFTIVLAPICPHVCEHIWSNVLGRSGFVIDASWPTAGAIDETLLQISKYLEDVAHSVQVKLKELAKKKGKSEPRKVTFQFAQTYPVWQQTVINLISEMDDFAIQDRRKVSSVINATFAASPELTMFDKRAVKFAMNVIDEVNTKGRQVALASTTPFDEETILCDNIATIVKNTGLTAAVVVDTSNTACPGRPSVRIV